MGLGDVLPSMWGECEQQDGMHFNAQRYVAVELIDPDTGEQKAVGRRRHRRARLHHVRARRHAGGALPLARPCAGDRRALCMRPHEPAHPRDRAHRRHADLQGHERVPDRDPRFCRAALRRPGGAAAAHREGPQGSGALRPSDCRSRSRPRVARRRATGRAAPANRRRGARAAAGARGGQRAAAWRAAARHLQESRSWWCATARRKDPPHEVPTRRLQQPPSLVVAVRALAGSPGRRVQPRRRAWRSRATRWRSARCELERIDQLVLGTTVPQPRSFYAVPWIAARLGMPGITGPHIAQACATSVACVVSAALQVEAQAVAQALVVTADRTSNGPLLATRARARWAAARPQRTGCSTTSRPIRTPRSRWCTPPRRWRAKARMSRQALDELTLLRYQQYRSALADDRASSAPICSRW